MTRDDGVHMSNGSLPASRPAGGALERAFGGDELPASALAIAGHFDHEPILPLAERKTRIMDVLNRTATDIGAELIAAKEQHPGAFMAWVVAELPFGIDKAERLMAITRAFAEVSDDVLKHLPAPWTALYELSRVPPAALADGVERGEVTPTMTVDQARDFVDRQTREARDEVEQRPVVSTPLAEAHAVALLRHESSELTPITRERLMAWLSNG